MSHVLFCCPLENKQSRRWGIEFKPEEIISNLPGDCSLKQLSGWIGTWVSSPKMRMVWGLKVVALQYSYSKNCNGDRWVYSSDIRYPGVSCLKKTLFHICSVYMMVLTLSSMLVIFNTWNVRFYTVWIHCADHSNKSSGLDQGDGPEV